MGPLIVLILLFFVMYTVMIRPQQKRAREYQALIAAVEVGDEVMTTAGIFGSVVSIDGDVLGIEISPGVVMKVARAAIGRRILPETELESDDDVDGPQELGPGPETQPGNGETPGAGPTGPTEPTDR